MYNDCLKGKFNWVSNIKMTLCNLGFGAVWEYQGGIINQHLFVTEFRQRVRDCSTQCWNESRSQVSKLRYYNMFKTNFNCELYIQMNIPRKFKVAIAKFRMSSHVLEIEVGRHKNIPIEERICKLCNYDVECEFHVLLECKAFSNLRSQFKNIDKTLYNFVSIMKMEKENDVIPLASFIIDMFKLRRNYIELINDL